MTTIEPHEPDTAPAEAATPTGPPIDDPVRGYLAGDRLCVRCRYNLNGQPIVEEERYGLSVVHCPQCGQVAAVEEYPPLSRWVNRWAMLIAAGWLLFLFSLGLGSLILITATTTATAVEATDSYEGRLREEFIVWRDATYPDESDRSFWVDQTRFGEFWTQHGPRVLEAHPPFGRHSIEWDELALLLFPGSAAIVLGVVWSVLLITRGRWIIAVASWGLLAVVLAILGLVWLFVASLDVTSTEHVAFAKQRFPIMMTALPLIGVIYTIGLWVGRPLTRGLVRALLPPRLRGPLAILWTAEGKTVPRRSVGT